jgi:hypothetical protein
MATNNSQLVSTYVQKDSISDFVDCDSILRIGQEKTSWQEIRKAIIDRILTPRTACIVVCSVACSSVLLARSSALLASNAVSLAKI